MPRCKIKNCTVKRAIYGKPDEKPECCAKHKEEGMIDLKNKKCEFLGCNKQPSYNTSGEKPKFCVEHKEKDMVDVINKKCEFSGCNKQPCYNKEGEKIRKFCIEHKKDGMINVKDKKCVFTGCNILARFNKKGEKAKFCAEHKEEGMINVKDKICILCDETYANKKYKGYCFRCFVYTFPDEKITRNYKVKEQHVVDFIKNEFKDLNMEFDKIIKCGCSKRRPDCIIDLYHYVIIIEIDENQHQNYICEQARMEQIYEDLGNRPVIFIRFNTDSYKKNGKIIKSCFKYHKTLDVPIIANVKQWNNRLETLKNTINDCINNKPTQSERIIQINLFYDM